MQNVHEKKLLPFCVQNQSMKSQKWSRYHIKKIQLRRNTVNTIRRGIKRSSKCKNCWSSISELIFWNSHFKVEKKISIFSFIILVEQLI